MALAAATALFGRLQAAFDGGKVDEATTVLTELKARLTRLLRRESRLQPASRLSRLMDHGVGVCHVSVRLAFPCARRSGFVAQRSLIALPSLPPMCSPSATAEQEWELARESGRRATSPSRTVFAKPVTKKPRRARRRADRSSRACSCFLSSRVRHAFARLLPET